MEVDRRHHLRRHEDQLLLNRLRKLFMSVAIGYLILLGAIAGALYALERRDRDRLHDAQSASCTRVNGLREQGNQNALVIYGALYASGVREQKLAETTTGRYRKTHRRSAHFIRIYTDALRHTATTDCKRAVDDPTHYTPPQPVRFKPADLKGTGLGIPTG